MKNAKPGIVSQLRNIAKKLEKEEGVLMFPGWEKQECDTVRQAISAIASNDDPDTSTAVSFKDVGWLVEYIADMME